jgi:L-fuculose-phosphate aldolase
MDSGSRTEFRLRRDICAAGRALRELGFIPAAAGNLSVRLDDGRILATPSGVPKGGMQPADLVLLREDGRPAGGADLNGRSNNEARTASSEMLMHLRIYALRPDVRAVCHAHPPTATGFATAGRALDSAALCETALLLGAIPLTPYAAPGTEELPDSITPFVRRANALLLANHGVVTYGDDLRAAMHGMEIVEHCAKVTLIAELAGGARLLTRAQVQGLVASRKRYGLPPLPVDAIPWITADDRRGK